MRSAIPRSRGLSEESVPEKVRGGTAIVRGEPGVWESRASFATAARAAASASSRASATSRAWISFLTFRVRPTLRYAL
jgi:hypothetical protein